ncbi:S1C family serine protease [Parvicella tangerina]|uniref:Periplasmic pH-dependent serine endoprotease DegQ n=1 Tax=Parvicella tangerina TaxID=2829795 RepID=A0A916JNY4_9FLAO|nr:trypsin-like peptidase domain-containing protein [Parvicella tangerina]CAG5084584.1 Periplasmic pH-dependent serine endoprotease DegQ [Parvicella tangerina]
MKSLTSVFISSILGASIALGIYHGVSKENTKIIVKETASDSSSTSENRPYQLTNYNNNSLPLNVDFTEAASNSLDAVVHINTRITVGQVNDPVYRLFYGNAKIEQKASGSGVVISPEGYIVTNNHVVADANSIEVTLNNSETYKAELIGTDPSTDLALLKVNAKNLHTIQFANSDDVKVGEWALAVGNPFNLTSTVTAGIVSAKARNIHILQGNYEKEIFPIESFIQTDAAVNPGNSGGALVNSRGELIGINTAIASKTGSYSGYSFAIPSNLVKKVAGDLAKYGSVQRGFIGVNLKEINTDLLQSYDLPNLDGVLIAGVIPESGADDAGIVPGDVVLAVGDIEVHNIPGLQEQIGKYSPGDSVPLLLRRGNKTIHKEVQLKKI